MTSKVTYITAAAGNSTINARQLRVQLHVEASGPLANDAQQPQLTGQTEASADAEGLITITDVRLVAAPSTYFLYISLPDYPDVSTTNEN